MADAAAKIVYKTRPRSGRDAYIIADGVTVYEGMLVGIAAGYANHWADAAADEVFAGILLGGDDRARDGIIIGETSDTPPPECRVDTSGVVLMHLTIAGTPTQAKVGDPVYSADSAVASITLTIGALNHLIGHMIRYRSSTDVDVQLITPAEFMAQAVA